MSDRRLARLPRLGQADHQALAVLVAAGGTGEADAGDVGAGGVVADVMPWPLSVARSVADGVVRKVRLCPQPVEYSALLKRLTSGRGGLP
ncbi:hypothetical protein BHU25_13660 [Pseudomonas vranovensis]|uniref:Uncharacterized protein n=1 Tax=Pseudomonas vranovensis TaxID=321661 RepID=A0A423DM81_9PSED|nr:hypothetical protein BHU25_13660 [Pseudomonas vranovensis]